MNGYGIRTAPSAPTGSIGHKRDLTMCVEIEESKKGYRLETAVWLKREIADVFAFFSDARNLNLITPEWIRFRIQTPMPVVMKSGLLLDYSLQFRGIPVRWQSEITVWDPPHRFVDEQRKGPYRRWVHEHLFQEKDGGTEVVDRVDYAVPGGRLVHRLFVKGDVTSIFRYRRRKLTEIFQGAEGRSAGLKPLQRVELGDDGWTSTLAHARMRGLRQIDRRN
jgi:ligand-binding SRPBCC domain-containing protein